MAYELLILNSGLLCLTLISSRTRFSTSAVEWHCGEPNPTWTKATLVISDKDTKGMYTLQRISKRDITDAGVGWLSVKGGDRSLTGQIVREWSCLSYGVSYPL